MKVIIETDEMTAKELLLYKDKSTEQFTIINSLSEENKRLNAELTKICNAIKNSISIFSSGTLWVSTGDDEYIDILKEVINEDRNS